MIKKWIAGALAALLAGALLIGCGKNDPPPTDPSLSSPVNSAKVLDQGELTYYLDNDGALWVNADGQDKRIAELSAEQIALVGGDIWYADGASLYIYSLTDGSSKRLCALPAEIDSFSVCGEAVYCLANSAIYGKNGKLITDFKGQTASDGNDLSNIERITMESADEILLYLPNPDYVDEEGVEDLPIENDVNLTYRYSLTAELITALDQFHSDEEPSNASSGGSYVINGVTFPFAEHPVGSYFSQNGKACTCHSGDCVSNNSSKENCIRYWPSKSNYQVDLKGVQCMGFARLCQWKLYGSHDFSNTKDFYNALGSKLNAGSWSANTIKNIFTDVGPGGHIRTGAGHSLFVISVSASGFVTYECNTGNRDCKIYTRQWTWDSFFDYAGSRPLMYYNMPRESDNSGQVTSPADEYQIGTYQVVANSGLNLRAQASASSTKLATIPQGTLIDVSAVQQVGNYYWGYTQYDGKYGWVRLDYALYQNSSVSGINVTTLPNKTSYIVGDSFSTAGMVVEATFKNGAAFEIAGYTCSGYNMSKAGKYSVTVSYGSFKDTFTIEVKEKEIPPTSISLGNTSITLIVGDTYQLDYTILPKDTTQKDVTWSASSPAVASIESGIVSAHAPGSSTVTITTQNGKTATCRVTVITMPTGVNWSTTVSGEPLSELPDGITAVDYSLRYRLPDGNGWGEWVYATPPEGATNYQCQFRAFTATFVDTLDGKTVEQFTVEFNEIITFSKYPLSKNGYLFTGWYTDPQAAQSHDSSKAFGSQVTVTGDLLVYAGWIKLEDITADSSDQLATADRVPAFGIAGTELRISDDAPGIRFLARISTDLIRSLESLHGSNKALQPSGSSDTGIGFGMVVQLKGASSASLVKGSAGYLYKGGAVTVPAYRTYAEYNGYIVYNAFVCGFSEQYYKSDFIARPYLTYADANGNVHTYYFTATGDGSSNGGIYTSLYAEAEKLAASPTTNEATKRWLQDNILMN